MLRSDVMYRIGAVQPSRGLEVERLLDEGGMDPVYLKAPMEIRTGRDRKREVVERPLLPGVVFVPDPLAAQADRLLGTCGLALWWVRNPASRSGVALCSPAEVQPMVDWIEAQHRMFADRAARRRFSRSGEAIDPLPPRDPGSRVTLRGGPFDGADAVIVMDDGVFARILIGPMLIPA